MHYGPGGADVVLEMGHQVCAVPFYLLVGGYSAEDYFGELPCAEFAECDAAEDFGVCGAFMGVRLLLLFDDGEGEVGAVEDESGDVIFGHFGELLLEETF